MALDGAIVVGRRRVEGVLTNLNLSGFFIQICEDVPLGELVRLEVELPDGAAPLACFGWVRSCDITTAGGAGVQLFALSREQHDRWVGYYQNCRRELQQPPPEPVGVVVVQGGRKQQLQSA